MKTKRLLTLLVVMVFVMAVVVSAGISAYAFSEEYEPIYPHITAVTRSVDEIYARVSGSTIELPEATVKARKEMIQMFKDVGIDISLDMENWLASYRLIADFPQRWSEETPIPLGDSPDYSGAFSIDACWNNKIPDDAPMTLVPREALSFNIHIGVVKANVDDGGWGTGLPQIVSSPTDPYYTIASKYEYADINRVFMLRANPDLYDYMNNAQTGDEHGIFVDGSTHTAVQTWLTRVPGDPRGYGLRRNRIPNFDVRASSIGIEYSMGGIGAEGQCGVNAANCVTNAYTIKSSEISSTTEMFKHALGGAINEMIGGRVFPALSVDGHMSMYGENEGSRQKYNTGAVPYGGVIVVDRDIDLKAMYDAGKLSFHSYRILTAMQEYGFYNIDTSGGSFFFYTNTYSKDWINSEFRGFDVPYKKNAQGFAHVVDELKAFFAGDEFFGFTEPPKIYQTIPVAKYADLDVNDDGVIDQADYDEVAAHEGQEYTDANKQFDVNQDKIINAMDIEIMYNYLNDMPMHTFTWYDASYVDNDETHGRIIGSGTSRTIDGRVMYRENAYVSFAAVPKNGYEFVGWTGDFAKYDTPVVKVVMDRDYQFGAKYKKLADQNVTVKVLGPGHVEVSETGILYDAPKATYGKNSLLAFKAVPDEGYAFLGWAGDITGYTNPAEVIIDRDKEIIAMFGEVGYTEEFKKDEWELVSGSDTAYTWTEGSKIFFKDFSQGNQLLVNKNKADKIDMSGDFTVRVNMSAGAVSDGNMGKFVFNYKDKNNYYYLTLGGNGGVKFGKVYKGTSTQIKEYKGSLFVNDIGFNKLPILIEISKSGAYIAVSGYKNGEKLEYFEVRDKTFSGGTYGAGSVYNGDLTVSGIVLQSTSLDPAKAVVQDWAPTGNNAPWLEKLRGAVVVAAGSNKAYAHDDYTVITEDGSIMPYFGEDGTTVYVPVKYVVTNLGGKVVYDPATDSVLVTYGDKSVTYKAWTNGAQEVNGTLYVIGEQLAKDIGKEFYQYEGKAPVFFSDTPNVYDPNTEPECIEFIKKTFDIQYYM